MTLPKKVVARFEIVTPMFLGDADQEAAGIREASIKGALVYWWRALNYASFVQESGGNLTDALTAMQTREQALFGGGKHGQSAVLLKVDPRPILQKCNQGQVLNGESGEPVGEGTRYLGYGLMGAFGADAGKLSHSCFRSGNFKVSLIFRKSIVADGADDVDVVQNVVPALKAIGLIGGLGARKRRGWGSVALLSLKGAEEWVAPTTPEGYIEELNRLIGEAARDQIGARFPLTAFAKETDIRVGTVQNANALTVLNDLGEGFQRYRAWGHNGKVGGQDSEMNFQADHDWFKSGKGRPTKDIFKDKAGQEHSTASLPKRAAFGLPHNYFSRRGASNGSNLQMNVKAASGESDRRGSPLIFHIHKLSDGRCFAVASYFPTLFLENAKITVNKDTKDYHFEPDTIINFLNGIRTTGGHANPAYFPNESVLS